MKKILIISLTAIMALSLNNCMITNNLFKPMGTVKGSEVKSNVQSSATMGYMLGSELAFAQKASELGMSVSDVRSVYTTYYAQNENIIVSGIVASSTVPVEDGAYYTKKSADDCAAKVQQNTMLMTAVLYDMIDNGSYTIQADDMTRGPLAGILGSSACKLEKSGDILYLDGILSL